MKRHPFFDVLFLAHSIPDRDTGRFERCEIRDALRELVMARVLPVCFWPGWWSADESGRSRIRSDVEGFIEDRKMIGDLLCMSSTD